MFFQMKMCHIGYLGSSDVNIWEIHFELPCDLTRNKMYALVIIAYCRTRTQRFSWSGHIFGVPQVIASNLLLGRSGLHHQEYELLYGNVSSGSSSGNLRIYSTHKHSTPHNQHTHTVGVNTKTLIVMGLTVNRHRWVMYPILLIGTT